MLQIIDHDLLFDGHPSVLLNYDGFEIPIADEHPELKEFNVKTFYTFIKNHSTDAAYVPVNKFYSTLSLEHQKEVASTFLMLSAQLKQPKQVSDDVFTMMDACEILASNLDETIELCPRIHHFIQHEIKSGAMPMIDMSDAGSRPQDRKDMTFYQHEAESLTEIAMLSKMFSIFSGEFIYRCTGLINAQYKESICCQIFSTIFKRHYFDLLNKLDHYITRLVEPKFINNVAAHFQGLTQDFTASSNKETTIIKKLVSIDLYQNDGSVIKYIASCTKSFVESQSKSGAAAYNIKIFTDPKDGDLLMNSEETNSSRVEIESISSRKPLSTIVMAQMAIDRVVKEALKSGMVDPELFNAAMEWYKDNPILISPIGLFLVASYFGPDICGGKSVYQVDDFQILRLAVIMQIQLIKNDYSILPHALTLMMSTSERASQIDDFAFANSWKASAEYADCRKTVVPGYGEVSWDTMPKNITELLTTKHFTYHTAPAIQEFMKLNLKTQEERDKFVMKTNESFHTERNALMEELALILKDFWKQRKLQEDGYPLPIKNSKVA